MMSVLLILNLAFISKMLYHLLEGYLEEFQPQLDLVKNKIKEKKPEL